MNNMNICLTNEDLNFRSKLCQYSYYYIEIFQKTISNYHYIFFRAINFLEH